MKKTLKTLLVAAGFLLASLPPLAAGPAEDAIAKLAVPAERVAAQQVIMDYSRTFVNPSPEAKAWFEALRNARLESKDPEAQAALGQALLLDPSTPIRSPQGKAQVRNFPAPEGTTPETKLAETERQLDLKPGLKQTALSVEELTELTRAEDFATAQRANRLLRRLNPAAAAPILWERLAKTTQRSQIQEIEDELLRLPPGNLTKVAPKEMLGSTPAQKAAWLRIVSVRRGVKVDRALILPLLKGPANELTEAAWDSVPYFFTVADKAQFEEAAQGLSPRLQPRAKTAIESLR